MKAQAISRRKALIGLGVSLPLALHQFRNALEYWALKPELEDLAGRAVVKKISAELPATDSFGRLRLSGSAREDLTKFLLADEIEMPVRMPTKLDKDIIFLLFTHSTIPEHLKVTMQCGPDGEFDTWRLMSKERAAATI